MSGGHFEYNQYRIRDIWETIRAELDRQGNQKPDDEYYYGEEDKYYPTYSKQVQDIFSHAIKYLKLAEIYSQRIDYFLSGDDGEENFIKRLEEEINNVS